MIPISSTLKNRLVQKDLKRTHVPGIWLSNKNINRDNHASLNHSSKKFPNHRADGKSLSWSGRVTTWFLDLRLGWIRLSFALPRAWICSPASFPPTANMDLISTELKLHLWTNEARFYWIKWKLDVLKSSDNAYCIIMEKETFGIRPGEISMSAFEVALCNSSLKFESMSNIEDTGTHAI